MTRRGVVLDVEAVKANWEFPEKSGFKCATVMHFEFGDDFVVGIRHSTFEEPALALLGDLLKKEPGIILGFKPFFYDFRILGSRMDVPGILKKTVDLSVWKEERFSNFVQAAFDFRQMIRLNVPDTNCPAATFVHEKWRLGNTDAVFEANQNDCVNLLLLWAQMLFKREICIPYARRGTKETVFLKARINELDLKILRGEHNYFAKKDWPRLKNYSPRSYRWTDGVRYGRGPLGKCPNRNEFYYQSIASTNGKHVALFFVRRNRIRKSNREYAAGPLAGPDWAGLTVNASEEPIFLGVTSAKTLCGADNCTLFSESDLGTIWAYSRLKALPSPIKRHFRTIAKEVDHLTPFVLRS